jgi:hypothetical protein
MAEVQIVEEGKGRYRAWVERSFLGYRWWKPSIFRLAFEGAQGREESR